MSHTSIETPHRKRCPMSAEQRAKLSLAQRAYVTHDPRWAEHRRKLAAPATRRGQFLPNGRLALKRPEPAAETAMISYQTDGVIHSYLRCCRSSDRRLARKTSAGPSSRRQTCSASPSRARS